MLGPKDIRSTKPFLLLLTLKTVSFLALLIFLPAVSLTGFTSTTPVTHCDLYFNLKITSYQGYSLMVNFILTSMGFVSSCVNLVLFSCLVYGLKKEGKQKQSSKKRLTSNRLKTHFVLTFTQTICTLNIFIRALQQVTQHSVCNTYNHINFIVILTISSLSLLTLIFTLTILFRFLTLIQKKQQALEQYTFYSDQITLQENLLFNKAGYIKELIKVEDYTSRSSMKDESSKNTYTGYKANPQLSPRRQIIHKLRGGHENYGAGLSSMSSPRIPEDDNQGDTSNNNDLNKSRFQESSQQGKPLHLNLLAVNNTMDETPNDESFQYVELTHNVIDLAVDRGQLQDLNEQSEYESSEEESDDYEYQKQIMKKNGLSTPKKQEDLALEMKIQEELRHKFNLTSNGDMRRRYAHRRNQQNIDDYGNYFYVDVQKIKKRSKLLNFNDQTSNIDPNAMYAKEQQISMPVRQKRLPKKHQKYVADYLKKLNKLKKQEMLFKEESSYYSDQDFDEDSQESSQEDDEQQQSSQVVDTVPVTVIDPVTGQPITVIPEKKKSKKNQGPQLYLYIKKRKNPGRFNKLKLFEDDEGFYDSEDSKENEQKEGEAANNPDKGLGDNLNGQKMVISATSKEHQGEKSKHEEKVILTNKYLDTDEARMLRFIRRKYISKGQDFEFDERGHMNPNVTVNQGHPLNFDPNTNLNPIQMMMPGSMPMNPGMGQNPNFNPNQPNQLPISQPYQSSLIEGNIFAPPQQNSQMSPVKNNNSGLSAYQMNTPQPQQSSPGFPTPFNLQTPQTFNQPNSSNQGPYRNYSIPQNNANNSQPNLMGSLMQPNGSFSQAANK